MSQDIAPELAGALKRTFERSFFDRHLGITVEGMRADYARMRLPHRPFLDQPAGVVHGGAIASLIDSVAGLAVFTGLARPPRHIATIDIQVHYLGAARGDDLIAEARIRKRGRSIVFVGVDVETAGGDRVAHGELSFRLVP